MAEKRVFKFDDKNKEKPVWVNIDKWSENEDYYIYDDEKYTMTIRYEDRFYTGRNYNLFCALAGVRASSFYDEPKIISKPKGTPKDASRLVKLEAKRWKGDGHSHSWLTLEELKSFDWSQYGNTCDRFTLETIPKLEQFKDRDTTDEDIRIVFFFDN